VTLAGLHDQAHATRRLVLEIALAAGSCHIGSALSMVDVLTVLYHDVLREPAAGGDRFVLSKGHGGSALYATLATAGVLDADEVISGYSRDGGRFAGHPERGLPGIEITGGSLGHGLSIALGLALADRLDGSDRRTFCLLGDGELQEGSVWEALMLAGQQRVGGLTAIVDANGLQGLGRVRDVVSIEPLATRLASFGWAVREVDGHDLAQLRGALGAPDEQPTLVLARTVKGYGVPFMEDELMWHYRSLREADRERVMDALEESRSRLGRAA
jgi:transketolase